MIRNPTIGQPCEPWYRKAAAHRFRNHGKPGVVLAVGRGPGPHNVAVRMIGAGEVVVVPKGNLREAVDWRRVREGGGG